MKIASTQVQDLTLASIFDAANRIAGLAIQTPLKPSSELSRRTGGQIFLKMENMQDTGSFKIRGAANAILHARNTADFHGVVAASSGNHGKSVAYVARRLGLTAVICMTELVPDDKRLGIQALGAEVIISGKNQNEAVDAALAVAEERSLVYIPPFDDPQVIAGQGTIGLELFQQRPEIDTLIVPVSGGGLISGIALAARAINPGVDIIGVSSEKDAAMYESIKAGKVVNVDERPSIADALPGPIPLDNKYTFELCRTLVTEIVPVSEKQIAKAMRYCIDYEQVVLEGAGAASVAYVLDGKNLDDRNVAVICSGCNISGERLAGIFEDFGLN
jgi:threonine dehydratase